MAEEKLEWGSIEVIDETGESAGFTIVPTYPLNLQGGVEASILARTGVVIESHVPVTDVDVNDPEGRTFAEKFGPTLLDQWTGETAQGFGATIRLWGTGAV